MNILIVTPHFYPENFRINDFAVEFQKKGHNITVLTGIPDYPAGKYFEIPAAGCMSFMEVTPKNHAKYLGFKNNETAIFIDEKNYKPIQN